MTDSHPIAIKRALLSVSDKTGIAEFAQGLHERGVELLSTGGTCRLLRERGIPVREISDYTGFPELMDGRVKTLHPKVHGGILARRGSDEGAMAEHGIQPIDMVVVNLYPFEQTVAQPGCTLADAVENIDIGGPTLVRAAAKNHRFVTVVVRAGDYPRVLGEMDNGGITPATRFDLAVRAFEHTAAYDAAIANHFGALVDDTDGGDADDNVSGAPAGDNTDGTVTNDNTSGAPADNNVGSNKKNFPRTYTVQFHKKLDMRYGENPHQGAAFYTERDPAPGSIATAVQLQGKALSYNNVADTDAALECVKGFDAPACVIVKHANPCGVAVAADLHAAYERAYATDPESAFGGIIAFNRELDAKTMRAIIERQFVEVIIAPRVTKGALAEAKTKPNLRVLACGWGEWAPTSDPSHHPAPHPTPHPALDYKRVNGGLLLQDRDLGKVAAADLQVVSQRQPSAEQMKDLLFAWQVAKFVKSNAIVYAAQGRTIGVGAGQMSRVNSARIAAIKAEQAGLAVAGAVMASDAFFPFRDGIDNAAQQGITAVIQPGGSMRDEEVIAAADEHGMAMVFTGMRHFRH